MRRSYYFLLALCVQYVAHLWESLPVAVIIVYQKHVTGSVDIAAHRVCTPVVWFNQNLLVWPEYEWITTPVSIVLCALATVNVLNGNNGRAGL